jgi:hypothetical protein
MCCITRTECTTSKRCPPSAPSMSGVDCTKVTLALELPLLRGHSSEATRRWVSLWSTHATRSIAGYSFANENASRPSPQPKSRAERTCMAGRRRRCGRC